MTVDGGQWTADGRQNRPPSAVHRPLERGGVMRDQIFIDVAKKATEDRAFLESLLADPEAALKDTDFDLEPAELTAMKQFLKPMQAMNPDVVQKQILERARNRKVAL